jgi:hypothetical protein
VSDTNIESSEIFDKLTFYRGFSRSLGKAAIGRDVKDHKDFSSKPLLAPLCHHKVLNLVTGNLADPIVNFSV